MRSCAFVSLGNYVRRTDGRLSAITIGQHNYGAMLEAPLPESGPWPLVGILDEELAQVAWNLQRGALIPLGLPNLETVGLSIVPIGNIAGRGPYHSDINWSQSDGTPRGPFELIIPQSAPCPRIRCSGPTMLNASGGLLLNLTPKVRLNQRPAQ